MICANRENSAPRERAKRKKFSKGLVCKMGDSPSPRRGSGSLSQLHPSTGFGCVSLAQSWHSREGWLLLLRTQAGRQRKPPTDRPSPRVYALQWPRLYIFPSGAAGVLLKRPVFRCSPARGPPWPPLKSGLMSFRRRSVTKKHYQLGCCMLELRHQFERRGSHEKYSRELKKTWRPGTNERRYGALCALWNARQVSGPSANTHTPCTCPRHAQKKVTDGDVRGALACPVPPPPIFPSLRVLSFATFL